MEFISSPLDSRLCDLLWPTEFSGNDGVPVLDYLPKALHALLTLLEPWNHHEDMPGRTAGRLETVVTAILSPQPTANQPYEATLLG